MTRPLEVVRGAEDDGVAAPRQSAAERDEGQDIAHRSDRGYRDAFLHVCLSVSPASRHVATLVGTAVGPRRRRGGLSLLNATAGAFLEAESEVVPVGQGGVGDRDVPEAAADEEQGVGDHRVRRQQTRPHLPR